MTFRSQDIEGEMMKGSMDVTVFRRNSISALVLKALDFLYPKQANTRREYYRHYMNRRSLTHRLIRARSKSSFLSVLVVAVGMHLVWQASATTLWVDNLAASPPPGIGCG